MLTGLAVGADLYLTVGNRGSWRHLSEVVGSSDVEVDFVEDVAMLGVHGHAERQGKKKGESVCFEWLNLHKGIIFLAKIRKNEK